MGSRSFAAPVLCLVLGLTPACKESASRSGAGSTEKTEEKAAPSFETTTTGGGGGAKLSASPRIHPKVAKAIERLAGLKRFTLRATEREDLTAGTPRAESKEAFVDRSTFTITYRAPAALREHGKLERTWRVPRPKVGVFLAGEHDIVRVGGKGVMHLVKLPPSDPDSRSIRIQPEVFAFVDDPLRIAENNSIGLLEEQSFLGAVRKVAELCSLTDDPPVNVEHDGEALERYRGSATAEQIIDALIRRRDSDLARYLLAAEKGEDLASMRYYMHVTRLRACHMYFDADGNLRGWDFGRAHDAISREVRLGVPKPTVAADAFAFDPAWERTPLAIDLDVYGRAAPLYEREELVEEVRVRFLEEWAAAVARNKAAPGAP